MGIPVSPVVANLCMEAIEEMAIKQLPFHLKYGNGMLMTVSASLKETQLTLSITHSMVSINTSPLPSKKRITTRLLS